MTVKRVTIGIPVDVVEWCVTHNIEMDICIEVANEFTDDGPDEDHEAEMIVRFAESMRWHLENHIVEDLKEVAAFREQLAELYRKAEGKDPRPATMHTESERVMSAIERHLFTRPDGTWRFPTNQSPEERLLEAIFNIDGADDEAAAIERHLSLVPTDSD